MIDSAAKSIIQKLTDGKNGSPSPQLIVVCGGMQTRQNALQRTLQQDGFIDVSNTIVIAPASFVPMTGYAVLQYVQHPEKTPQLVGAYQEIIRATVQEAVRRGSSIMLVDHGEDRSFITDVHETCKGAGYQTLLLGLVSTPESYRDHADFTERTRQRKADHPRGYSFLASFNAALPRYAQMFDAAVVLRSQFSLRNENPAMQFKTISLSLSFSASREFGMRALDYFSDENLAQRLSEQFVQALAKNTKPAPGVSGPRQGK